MTDDRGERQQIMTLVDDASARLLATVALLDEASLGEPSALPDWSRAHVLVHLARNGDGLRNLLLWARTGEPVRMYPSRAVRTADIDAAPGRSRDVIVADLGAAITRFHIDLLSLADQAWSRPIITTPGDVDSEPRPAGVIPLMRLTEVEIHHIDLAAGYGFADTPRETVHHLLGFIEARLRAVDRGFQVAFDDRRWTISASTSNQSSDQVITGTSGDLLAWLLGRSDGRGCQSTDGSALPALQPF